MSFDTIVTEGCEVPKPRLDQRPEETIAAPGNRKRWRTHDVGIDFNQCAPLLLFKLDDTVCRKTSLSAVRLVTDD